MKELKSLFERADKDGNGRIDKEELQALLESTEKGAVEMMEHWYTPEEVDAVLTHYDLDGSGDLDLQEFEGLVYDGILLDGKLSDYQKAFNALDTEGRGTIGAQQLVDFFWSIGMPVCYEALYSAFAKYDKDDSGRIDFKEFLFMFRDNLFDLKQVLSYAGATTPLSSVQDIAHGKDGETPMVECREDLDYLVAESNGRPIVLFATVTWSMADEGMHQPFQSLSEYYPDTVFCRLFANFSPAAKKLFKDDLKVRSTPSFLVFKDGKTIETITTTDPKQLETLIRKYSREGHLPADRKYPA